MADEQNSTAVSEAPVDQSQDANATSTQPTQPNQHPAIQINPGQDNGAAGPTPTPMTTTDVNDYTSNPTATPQPDPRNGVMAGGPVDPDTQNPTDGHTMALIPTKPLVAEPSLPTPPAAHPAVHRLLATAKAFTEGLTGGPQYKTTIDLATGQTVRTAVQPSGKQIGMAFALELLTGGLAGAGEHGPNAIGAAAGKGLEQGEKIADQRKQTQEVADQKAQQDYIRQFEAFKTNLQTFETMQQVGKHDYDLANSPVEANKGAIEYWRKMDPDKIAQENVSEADAMKADHTKVTPVPTATIPRIDPDTGVPVWQDVHGRTVPPNTPFSHQAFDHQYALITNDANVDTHDAEGNLTTGIPDQINKGITDDSMAQTGQTTKIPGSSYIQKNARVAYLDAFHRLMSGPSGVAASVNHYRQLVAQSQGNAGPNAVDPATDSVFTLFGGNTDKLADFITKHEGTTQADGSPSRSTRDNNPGNLVAGPGWTGRVDDKNLPPGQAPFRVYDSPEQGRDALDNQLQEWKKQNPDQSIQSFFQRYTTPGAKGPDGMDDQQRYIAAALKDQGASNVNSISNNQLKPMTGAEFDAFVKNTPGAERAIKAFTRSFYGGGNTNASLQYGLDHMPNSVNEKSIITQLMGNDPQAAVDYDSNRHNANAAVMEQTRNQAKLAYNDKKREQDEAAILDRNKDTIDAIVKGSAIDLRSILTMRAYDREIVTNELMKRTNGAYSPASIQNMIDLNKEINEKQTAGSFGNKLANFQTAFQHTSAADQQLNILQSMVPGLANNTAIMNGSMKDAAKYFEGISPQAAHAFVQYRTLLQTATHDWQNAVNNGYALHEDQLKQANDIVSDTSSFGNAHAALNGMMHSVIPRIDPLNEQYKTTMSTAHEKVNYPNLMEPATVEAIAKLNDPATMQAVAHYESGGTLTGGPRGLGAKGKEAGLMLTPAAPKPGTSLKSLPNAVDIARQYQRVYGNNPAEIKRAMQANGWQ